MVLPREGLLGSITILDKDGYGTVSANGARLSDVSDPVDGHDATNKNYVDSVAGGGTTFLPYYVEGIGLVPGSRYDFDSDDSTDPVDIAISPDGSTVIVLSNWPAARLIQLTLATPGRPETAEVTATYTITEGEQSKNGLYVSPDGEHLIIGETVSSVGYLRHYTLGTGWSVATISHDADITTDAVFGVDYDQPQSLSVSPDGTIVVVGFSDTIREATMDAWDIGSLTDTARYINSGDADSLAFSSDGGLLISAGYAGYPEGAIRSWEAPTPHSLEGMRNEAEMAGVITTGPNVKELRNALGIAFIDSGMKMIALLSGSSPYRLCAYYTSRAVPTT